MNHNEPTAALEQRVITLESALAHQQREFEVLNQVVVEQAGDIQTLQRKVTRLDALLEQLQQNLPDERAAEDEKPPHY